MEYFSHNKSFKNYGPVRSLEVYRVLYEGSLVNYARKIYKGRYHDALDKAFIHILENYDESTNNLEHYATSVISKIGLNDLKYEAPQDEALMIETDVVSYESDYGNPVKDIIRAEEAEKEEEDLKECIKFLTPYFIEDYKLFQTLRGSDRKLNYANVYDKFSESLIYKAVLEIRDKYFGVLEELNEIKRNLNFRLYDENRYLKSIDNTLEIVSEVNGVILYTRRNAKKTKYLYEINLRETITDIMRYFYSGRLNRQLGNITVYCTLNGRFVCSEEDLYNSLEKDVIGVLLSHIQAMKVVQYVKGEKFIMVYSKPYYHPVSIDEGEERHDGTIKVKILDKEFYIEVIKRTSRCI